MEYSDKVLKCADCSAEFIFTAGEQMFFADKGFKNEPKRCKACKGNRGQSAGAGSGSEAADWAGGDADAAAGAAGLAGAGLVAETAGGLEPIAADTLS